jgi:hypothetical protein
MISRFKKFFGSFIDTCVCSHHTEDTAVTGRFKAHALKRALRNEESQKVGGRNDCRFSILQCFVRGPNKSVICTLQAV